MTAFIPKRLPIEETVGEKLRQKRRLKNLKIEEIAKIINIRSEYLIALEEELFDKLPSGLYGKNYLKEYALFLGLNQKELLKTWEEQFSLNEKIDPFSQKIVKKNKFIIFPRIIRNIIITTVILICFLYLIFYFKKVITPPKLLGIQPSRNILTKTNSIIVSGQSEIEAEIRINNEIVLNNHGGFFSQNINLKKGLNTIVITAKKKYSGTETTIREVLVE